MTALTAGGVRGFAQSIESKSAAGVARRYFRNKEFRLQAQTSVAIIASS
jgi:hypothetical protein